MRAAAHSCTDSDSLTFATDGAQRFPGAAAASLVDIERVVAHLARDRAGIRLHGIAALRDILASSGAIGALGAEILGAACRPVRAILFDKTPSTNWSLAWHQDRTIVVEQRRDFDGFGPWTTKGGLQHVAPPFDLLASMVTLRVHLDSVSEDNAPLLIAPGSHHFGRVAEGDIPKVVEQCGVVPCLAERGDIWVYATPILHASEAASSPRRRRVLQVDYAACGLPGGLNWLGV